MPLFMSDHHRAVAEYLSGARDHIKELVRLRSVQQSLGKVELGVTNPGMIRRISYLRS